MDLIPAAGFHAARLLWTAAQSSMKVEILNKCSDIELVGPVHFSDGATCHMPLDQKTTPDGKLDTIFKINLGRITFEGALTCRLRKKGIISGQQPNSDATNIDENESKCVQLLVGWKLERFQDPRIYVLLVEHVEKFVWNEDTLRKQHNEFRGRLNVHNGAVTSTWLMEDGSVLELGLHAVGSRVYGIKITISETQKDDYTSVPMWIELKV
jgi:hypothetical protein